MIPAVIERCAQNNTRKRSRCRACRPKIQRISLISDGTIRALCASNESTEDDNGRGSRADLLLVWNVRPSAAAAPKTLKYSDMTSLPDKRIGPLFSLSAAETGCSAARALKTVSEPLQARNWGTVVALTTPGRGASRHSRSGPARERGAASQDRVHYAEHADGPPIPSASTATTISVDPGVRRTEARPYRKSRISVSQPPNATPIAMLFFHLLDCPKTPTSFQSSRFSRETTRNSILLREFEGRTYIIVQLPLKALFAQERP